MHRRAFLGGLALIGFAPAAGRASRKLALATTEYPPYYGRSLPNGGPVTELSVLALRHSGYDAEVQFLPWARALQAGKDGSVDALVGVWHAPERDKDFLFSEPVISNRILLCRKQGRTPTHFTGFEALRPYTVGVVRGYADPPGLAAAGIKVEAVGDDLQNLRKLLADRIDLVLIDGRVADHLIRLHMPEARPAIHCIEPPVQQHPQHLATSRRAADAAEIVAAFNRGLHWLRESGRHDEILARARLAT
jgi:polar amino acid transport system substrate-binding protein